MLDHNALPTALCKIETIQRRSTAAGQAGKGWLRRQVSTEAPEDWQRGAIAVAALDRANTKVSDLRSIRAESSLLSIRRNHWCVAIDAAVVDRSCNRDSE